MANRKKFVAKNGITVGTGHITTDVIDQDGHITANTVTISGTLLNATAFAGTANNASYLEGSNGSYYTGYSDNKAANAYSNATTYASNASNITTGTLTANVLATSGVTANTYGNSSSIPVITIDDKGRITSATTNAVAGVTGYTYTPANSTFIITTGAGSTFPATITTANDSVDGVIKVVDSVSNVSIYVAASANSVKTAYDNATTAYSNAATYADNKAANAYSNAVSYAGTIAGTAYSNATTFASSAAATAYSNAVSAASSSAATAYSNATTFAANATNISSGTLAEARLPFRMDQNVRTNDTVSFGNMTITGNLTVTGTTVTVNANNLSIQDNMIYLNSNSSITNPDLGIAGNYNDGTYRHAGFFRDASDGVWKVFDQYLPEPDASPYIDTANASFRIANFQANVVTAASFSGNGASVTSVNAATVGGNTAGTLRSYSDSTAATAYSNATSYAATIAGTAYSNATSYAATIAGTAYTNATSFASSAAATAYSNATSYASSIAATAYSNAVSYFTTNSANSAIGITYNLIQNTDLNGTGTTNALTSFNAYFPGGGGYNQPVGGGQHFRILQFGRYNTTDSNYWRGQIAQSFYEDRMWFRKEHSTTWGSWQELWHTGNDGSGSGLDADLLDGLNQTTAATASTIVARDSGGDITGRYFFGVHFNQSSSNSENPTIAAFWTNSGSDNYCRKSTPAHVISQLGLWTSSNDGSGSGLDADLLDGNNSSAFLGAGSYAVGVVVDDTRNTATTPQTINQGVEFDFKANSTEGLSDGGGYFGEMTFRQYGSSTDWTGGKSHQLGFTDNDNIWHRSGTSTTWGSWYKLWHSNNDGAGSGLDADLWDGYNFSDYLNQAVKTDSSPSFNAVYSLRTGYAPNADTATLEGATIVNYGMTQAYLSSFGGLNTVIAGYSGLALVTSAVKRLSINGSGNITAAVDLRAPIFYDSNNTAYFLDAGGDISVQAAVLNGNVRINPRSESWAEGISFNMPSQAVWGGIRWVRSYAGSGGNWALGYLGVESSNDMAWWSGDNSVKWRLDHSGNETVSGSLRAPIFYDSNDTGYYGDFASGTALKHLRVNGDWNTSPFGTGHANFTVTGTYASMYQTATNGNLGYALHHIASDGSYHIYTGRGAVNGSSWDWGLRVLPNQDGNFVEFRTSARAPIFYDLNNTGYYIDGDNTSRMYQAQFTQRIAVGNGTVPYLNTGTAGIWYSNGGGANHFVGSHDSDNSWFGIYTSSAWRAYLTGGGEWHATGDVRAPIFYDRNDTSRNIDPSSTSYLNSLYASYQMGASRTSFYVGGNASTYYPVIINIWGGSTSYQYSSFIIERGGYDDPGYSGIGFSNMHAKFSLTSSGWGFGSDYIAMDHYKGTYNAIAKWYQEFQTSRLVVWLRGATQYNLLNVIGSFSISVGNTGGTSITTDYATYTATSTVETYATTTRTNDGSMWQDGALHLAGTLHMYTNSIRFNNTTSAGIINVDGNAGYRPDDEYGNTYMHNTGSPGGWYGDFSAYYFRNQSASNRASIDGSGNFVALGNVTAYGSPSDVRLKENLNRIRNAIDIVNNINGYRYNYIGKEEKLIGVVAQEVEKVLPEVVYEFTSLDDKDPKSTKAVRYEHLTVILLEAIKEQQKQIDELKALLLNK